jgi:hypothetical protein
MRYAFAPVAFGLGANALVARQTSTCYQLQASGGAAGILGQLGDGQNRIGGDGNPTGCYCLSGNGDGNDGEGSGGFTDSNGRGCILTPPTTQFQCDVGATPTSGFAVGSSGGVTYNGSGTFYACPVNDNGEYNIYSSPAPGQNKCVEISLDTAGSCGSGNGNGNTQPAGTQPAATQPVATVPVATQPEATVPVATQPAPTTVVTQTVATQTQPAATYPAEVPDNDNGDDDDDDNNVPDVPASGTAPYPTGPAATQPNGAGNTGYPGKPNNGQPGKPEGGKPGQPGGGKPGQPGGGKPGQPGGGKPGQPGGGKPGQPGYPGQSQGVPATTPAVPEAPENTVPTVPEVPVNTVPAVPEVPQNTVPAVPEVPENTVPAVPEVPVNTVPAVPEVPQNTVPAVPEVPENTVPAVPEVPQNTVPVVPEESVCVPQVHTVYVTAPAPNVPVATVPVTQPAATIPVATQPAATYPAETPKESDDDDDTVVVTAPAPNVPVATVPVTEPAATVPVATQPAATYPAETPEDNDDDDDDDGNNNGNSGSCPQDLNGNYEYPHTMVPVDSSNPDNAAGTSYNGKVDSHTCMIYNFDIPASMAGKQCSTMFMLPNKEDLETSDYTMSGSGKCTVSKMKTPANAQTTYNNKSAKDSDVASMNLSPGNSYAVDSGDCAAGQTVSYMMCGSGDFSMDYFQDWNPSPIGMYVRQC